MRNLFGLEKVITEGDTASLCLIFDRENYPSPTFRWNISETDLVHESLRVAYLCWADGRTGNELPNYRSFDPTFLHPYLGYATLLEPTESGSDFRYRLYGSKVAHLAGFEMTGKLVSEMKAPPILTAFILAGHLAVSHRRQPLLSIHEPPVTSNVSLWTRLILPFMDEEGGVVRLLVMNQRGDLRQLGPDRLPRFYPFMD